jgi:hypothetical protein
MGTSVTITGTHFTGATGVRINGTATGFTVVSPTQILTAVPAGATTGRIGLTTPGGTAISSQDFTVVHAPAITSFTPSSGRVGAQVVVTGTDFHGASRVTFDGAPAAFLLLSGKLIGATVPAGATTGRISVTTPVGTGWSSAAFTVVNLPPDCSAALGTRITLWPPNQKMASIDLSETVQVTDPEGDPITITITGIHQDEPVATAPDSPGPDAALLGGDRIEIRAERDGGGNGRVYHVDFTATDSAGGACQGELLVTVPHNNGSQAIDDGELYDSTTLP